MKRLALSALLAVLALVGVASPAFAHTELISSDPADGATLAQRPQQLTLTFSEPVPAESAGITVTGPDGAAWPLGEISARGSSLVVPLKASGSPAGQHALAWRVESLDGDFVDGVITFTLPAPATGQAPTTKAGTPPTEAPPVTTTEAATSSAAATTTTATTAATTSSAVATATAAEEDGGGVPVWVWVLAAVALAAVGVAVALGRRRSAAADDGASTGATDGAATTADRADDAG
ncbi:copper resistance CopC family protein [Saccharothrix lopnurensis]|uniref:Copper resistance protein CopC n=1 Tax=Saccharothrix lopnurensis TaxID=1670621 RepID=A0ABW1P650_9PSEU